MRKAVVIVVIVLVCTCIKFGGATQSSYPFSHGLDEYKLTKEELKVHLESKDFNFFDPTICELYPDLMKDVLGYKPVVEAIVQAAVNGAFRETTYNDLAYFLDTFGPRLSGSTALECSIDYMKTQFETSGLDKVWTEDVLVPQWERGEEYAELRQPVRKRIAFFGLGQSVSTSTNGITADAVVFDSYQHLLQFLLQGTNQLDGKIAICTYSGPPDDVMDTINNGYSEIASAGAVAVLYKSAATFSIYSPHTRRASLYYNGVAKEIPIGYITIEDAEYFSRLNKRNESLQIYMKMLNTNANSTSRNLFGDLIGSGENLENANEMVIISAHTDSWDVGQGAQDDGIGVYLVLNALKMLKELKLRPRRTIRAALWTAEEYGYAGSLSYIQSHPKEIDNLRIAMEADYACLAPVGLAFNRDYEGVGLKPDSNGKVGNTELGCILQHVLELLGPISHGVLVQASAFLTDLDHFQEVQVPVVSLLGDDGRYFWYHHTEADTVTSLDSNQLDLCLAMWTATSYILADLTDSGDTNDVTTSEKNDMTTSDTALLSGWGNFGAFIIFITTLISSSMHI